MDIRYSRPVMEFLKSFDLIDDSMFPKIGGKNSNLVILRREGLPVPEGYSVSTYGHNLFLKNGQVSPNLVDEIAQVREILGGKIAIRSSANCEDGNKLSMAGVFESQYIHKDSDINEAVERIYTQSHSKDVQHFLTMYNLSIEDVRMALVVQKLIEPEFSGVIYTGVNGNNMLVQYVDGFGVGLVDGNRRGSEILLNIQGEILESMGYEVRHLSKNVVHQLAQYSQRIENIFSGVPQDIEFALKSETVHILQARTLTAKLGKVDIRETLEDTLDLTKINLRDIANKEKQDLQTTCAIFSDGNYSELLPRPKEMDIGLHMYVWGGSNGIPGAKQIGHRSMGYLVRDEANPIILFTGGRTYFSIGRYAGLFHVGFPELTSEYYSTLVNEYFDTIKKDPERGSYPQMGLFLQDPTLEDMANRFGERAQEYFQTYQNFSVRMNRFADEFLSEFNSKRLPSTLKYIQKIKEIDLTRLTDQQLADYAINILEHNRTESYVDFVKCARLGFYYSQRLQDLLGQMFNIEEDEVKRLYSRLNQGLDGSAITESNISIAEAPTEKVAMWIAKETIGHFSTGEMLEIRHIPLRDAPDKLLAYVQGIRGSTQYKSDFEKQRRERNSATEDLVARVEGSHRDELAHVIKSSQTYMAARETAKFYLTKEYLFLRDSIELLGKRKGLKEGDVYHLYPRELPQFALDPDSFLHLIYSRKQSFKNYPELDLSSVIMDSDIDNLKLSTIDGKIFTEEIGKFLAEGPNVEGVIVNSDEYENLEQLNDIINQYRNQGTQIIIAASQLNLSHDPFIAQAAGLVIKNAGIVAHGAQRARELGKGAIGGIDTRVLKTGMKILFNPLSRKITNLTIQ